MGHPEAATEHDDNRLQIVQLSYSEKSKSRTGTVPKNSILFRVLENVDSHFAFTFALLQRWVVKHETN